MQDQQKPAEQQHQQKPNQQPIPPPVRGSALVQTFYPIENLLKLYFVFASILLIKHTDKVALVICLMAVLRQLKKPQFNKEYLIKFLQNQFGLNILYILISFANGAGKTHLFYGPLFLHFLLGLCQYLNMRFGQNPLVKKLDSIIKLRQYRDMVLIQKGKIQVYYFIALACSLFMNLHRILPAILFGQFLYFKHKVSPQFKWSMYQIRQSLDPVFTRIPLVSWAYKKLCDVLGN